MQHFTYLHQLLRALVRKNKRKKTLGIIHISYDQFENQIKQFVVWCVVAVPHVSSREQHHTQFHRCSEVGCRKTTLQHNAAAATAAGERALSIRKPLLNSFLSPGLFYLTSQIRLFFSLHTITAPSLLSISLPVFLSPLYFYPAVCIYVELHLLQVVMSCLVLLQRAEFTPSLMFSHTGQYTNFSNKLILVILHQKRAQPIIFLHLLTLIWVLQNKNKLFKIAFKL